nr:RNA-dependent RNA polymerase [Solemoviridae sp.]
MTSSPGYPYMKEAPTNGKWLKWNGVAVDEIQSLRLWHDVKLVFADQYEQISRVFIKQEPHKTAKALENRWRLIIASSLPVQVAWHMLFYQMNDAEIDQAYNIPSQQGIVMVGGGWKLFSRSWVERGLTYGLDKSAWDWTAPSWALDLDLEFRKRMARGSRLDAWHSIAKTLYRHMFEDSKLLLSDGSLFQQVVPGVMKSGCVNTISTNSHCQVFVHIAVSLDLGLSPEPLPVCCGDDTLQHERHVHDLDAYRKYGIVVKSAAPMEFVGHEFHESGPYPLYVLKHIRKMHYVPAEILPQYFDSMARMYVHTPYYDMWESLASSAGINLPMSRESYMYWYDYSC